MKQDNQSKTYATVGDFIKALVQVDFNNRTAEFKYK